MTAPYNRIFLVFAVLAVGVFAAASWSLWRMVWHSAAMDAATDTLAFDLQTDHGIELEHLDQKALMSGYGTLGPTANSVLLVWFASAAMLVAAIALPMVPRIRRRTDANPVGAGDTTACCAGATGSDGLASGSAASSPSSSD